MPSLHYPLKKWFLLLCMIALFPICSSFAATHPFINVDPKLLTWLRSNVSPVTGLPFSFHIPQEKRNNLYAKTGKADSVTGIIERLILEEGISVYDAAVWQIALTILGGQEDLQTAYLPVEIYWHGSLRDLNFLRAGFDGQLFVYNPNSPEAVTCDPSQKGERGFLFRIINANGRYLMADPLDEKKQFDKFPNHPNIHWEDWKPIAGENAWVVMAALQLYHKKYYAPGISPNPYDKAPPDATELLLAKEIARAALLLQADNGGIRMAPLGTYYHLLRLDRSHSVEEISQALDKNAERATPDSLASREKMRTVNGLEYPDYHLWYYEEISTENNLSWYAAFRMLYHISGDITYKHAMKEIENYLKSAWDNNEHYFYQGMHVIAGQWRPNIDLFATDVQNWAIIVLGPQLIDEWFGDGTAYRLWKKTKELAGSFNESGELLGVGFTKENDRVSIEWTAGAILATRILQDYYAYSHTKWAKQSESDSQTMRNGIETYRTELTPSTAAYSYSSLRGWIPFGWFSHDSQVLSLVSTAWVVLIDSDINPFVLPDSLK